MALPKIQSLGLNKAGLTSIAGELLASAILIYNEQYDTEYTTENAPDEVNEFVIAFVAVMLFGASEIAKIENKAVKEALTKIFSDSKYAGIDETTNKEWEATQKKYDGKPVPEDVKNDFIEDRTNLILGGLALGILNTTNNFLAKKDGRNWVGAITRRDERVRAKHRLHDNKCWKNTGAYQPWYDYGCRCSYYYAKTEEELIELGFKAL